MHFVLLLILLALLAHTHAVIMLNNKDLLHVKAGKCVNPDIPGFPGPVFTECDARSSGCNTETLSCILPPSIGYTTGAFLNFTISTSAEMMPGESDGKIFVKVAFIASSLLSLKGYVQLYRYTKTVDGIELYDPTMRQEFIDISRTDSYTGVMYGVWFNGLVAGTYVVTYSDVGGTRYGLDIPEMSDPVVVESVFPIRLRTLQLRLIPENSGDDLGPRLLKYPDTYFHTGINPYLSYELTSEEAPTWMINQWLASAESKGRRLFWVHTTDMGNVINGKFEPAVNYSPYDVDADTLYKFKHYPMLSGNMRCNTPSPLCPGVTGRNTVINARLGYIGLIPEAYEDLWDQPSNGRQKSWGHATTIASKVLEVQFVEYEGYVGTPPANLGYSAGGLSATFNNYQTNVEAADGSTYDKLELWYQRHNQGCTDTTSCLKTGNQGMNFGGGTGKLTYRDWYKVEDVTSGKGDIQESQAFEYAPQFLDHVNTNADVDDCYCQPTGTHYAQARDLSGLVWNKYPFADIGYSTRMAYIYFSEDECELSTLTCGLVTPGPCDCMNTLFPFEAGACFQICAAYASDTGLYTGVSATCPPSVMFGIDIASGNIFVQDGDVDTIHDATLWDIDPKLARTIKDCMACGRPVHYRFQRGDATQTTYDTYMGDNYGGPFCQRSNLYTNKANLIDGDGDGLHRRATFLVGPTHCHPSFPTAPCGYSDPPSMMHRDQPAEFDQTRDWLGFPVSLSRGYITGGFGMDTQMATLQWRHSFDGGSNNDFRMWTSQMFATYARFKVHPTITFLNFQNARIAHDGIPDSIELVFTISCPLVETGYDDAHVGYCAETFSVTNQAGVTDLVLEQLGGPRDTINAAYTPFDVTLGPTKTQETYTVRIRYNDGDEIMWQFRLRAEPEKAIGDAFCEYLYGLPTKLLVPPKVYEFMSLVTRAATAQPACEYNKKEASAKAQRGQPYIYEAIVNNPLTNDAIRGQPYDGHNIYNYYYTWNSATSQSITLQGFSAYNQLWDPPMNVKICDTRVCQTIAQGSIVDSPLPAKFVNPLYRKPSCANTSIYGTCSINTEDDPAYSGIDVHQTATISMVDGTCSNQNLNKPRLLFAPPYSLLANVGSVSFSIPTEFTDPNVVALQTDGIFTQTMSYVTTETNDVACRIRYGVSINSIFEPQCVETLLTHSVILSNFLLDPAPLVRIPGCARSDNCCYRVPFVVSGNNPYTDEPVDMDDNATNSCYGQPPCLYEVVSSPAANVDGGLCLGNTYTFTVQSPAALVAARFIPAYVHLPDSIVGNNSAPRVNSSIVVVPAQPYHYAWRCPSTITLTLPISGISPIDATIVPGSCASNSNDVQFILTVNQPLCSGPVRTDNDGPVGCRVDLYVAIETLHSVSCSPLSCPPLLSPHLITGSETFTYNLQSSYFATGIPNGYWRAYFWIGSSVFASISDPTQVQTLDFLASVGGQSGMSIVRTNLFRPTCAGPNIVVDFNFKDLTFRGPYLFEWRTPSGRLIDDRTVAAIDYCNSGIVDPDQYQTACNLQIRSDGIPFTGYVQTGNKTSGESGLYTLTVTDINTGCGPEPYGEKIISLQTLEVQIQCNPTSCYGTRDGFVVTEVNGGTPIPIDNMTFVQANDRAIYANAYYYSWESPISTAGNSINAPAIQHAPMGVYRVNVTDYTGECTATASCVIESIYPPMRLVPVSSTPPNCTGLTGEIKFQVVNGTGNKTLYKISPASTSVGGGSAIISDSTVVPGINTTYIAMDEAGCISPAVSFTLQDAAKFDLVVIANLHPCGTNSPTGRMTAVVPAGMGTLVEWYLAESMALQASGVLVLDGAVAASYVVVATSSLYGCKVVKYFTLDVRMPPSVTMSRKRDENANSAFLQQVTGAVHSDNGPPYSYSFYGITVNGPGLTPTFSSQTLGDLGQFQMHLVPTTQTFFIMINDGGNCLTTVKSNGEVITVVDTIQSPTALPNITKHLEEVQQQINWRLSTFITIASTMVVGFIYFITMVRKILINGI